MGLIKAIRTCYGIEATYHRVFKKEIISASTDSITATIRSYLNKEASDLGSVHLDETVITFDLPKSFEGNINKEIYVKTKEIEKFYNSEDN